MNDKTSALQNTIENFINGNLTDAKKKAKRFSIRKLFDCAHDDFGYSENKARLIAFYLKGEATFEEVCQVE
jgi:hypothetical protein